MGCAFALSIVTFNEAMNGAESPGLPDDQIVDTVRQFHKMLHEVLLERTAFN